MAPWHLERDIPETCGSDLRPRRQAEFLGDECCARSHGSQSHLLHLPASCPYQQGRDLKVSYEPSHRWYSRLSRVVPASWQAITATEKRTRGLRIAIFTTEKELRFASCQHQPTDPPPHETSPLKLSTPACFTTAHSRGFVATRDPPRPFAGLLKRNQHPPRPPTQRLTIVLPPHHPIARHKYPRDSRSRG